jgi:hypothetical protein
LLQLAQLRAHLLSKLGIEVGQRLVHQAHGGPRDERPAQRDTLLLATRELGGLALQQGRQPHQIGDLGDPLRNLAGAHPSHRQAEADVVGDAQVGKSA